MYGSRCSHWQEAQCMARRSFQFGECPACCSCSGPLRGRGLGKGVAAVAGPPELAYAPALYRGGTASTLAQGIRHAATHGRDCMGGLEAAAYHDDAAWSESFHRARPHEALAQGPALIFLTQNEVGLFAPPGSEGLVDFLLEL